MDFFWMSFLSSNQRIVSVVLANDMIFVHLVDQTASAVADSQ